MMQADEFSQDKKKSNILHRNGMRGQKQRGRNLTSSSIHISPTFPHPRSTTLLDSMHKSPDHSFEAKKPGERGRPRKQPLSYSNKSNDVTVVNNEVVQQSLVSSSRPGPNILPSHVLGPLLLEALDGFLFMVNKDGTIEFVSDNVSQYIPFTEEDLVGKSIYGFLRIGSQRIFRDCLTPISQPSATEVTANRSITFDLDIRNSPPSITDELQSDLNDANFTRFCIIGIFQHGQYSRDCGSSPSSPDGENQFYLACIARRPAEGDRGTTTPSLDQHQFTTKQDLHGKILDCDSSATEGTIPFHEFMGRNVLEFCHQNDKDRLRQHHDEVAKNGTNTSGVYRFQILKNRFVFVQTKSKLFTNPTTNKPEFIMSTHSIVRVCVSEAELDGSAEKSLMQAIMGPPNANLSSRMSNKDGVIVGGDKPIISWNELADFMPGNLHINEGVDGVNGDGLKQLHHQQQLQQQSTAMQFAYSYAATQNVWNNSSRQKTSYAHSKSLSSPRSCSSEMNSPCFDPFVQNQSSQRQSAPLSVKQGIKRKLNNTGEKSSSLLCDDISSLLDILPMDVNLDKSNSVSLWGDELTGGTNILPPLSSKMPPPCHSNKNKEKDKEMGLRALLLSNEDIIQQSLNLKSICSTSDSPQQQPQSTTPETPPLINPPPTSPHTVHYTQSGGKRNCILKDLLSRDNDEDDEAPSLPMCPTLLPQTKRELQHLPHHLGSLDKGLSNQSLERSEVESTSGSNTLLKELLKSSEEEICGDEGRVEKRPDILSKLLSEVDEINPLPLAEISSTVDTDLSPLSLKETHTQLLKQLKDSSSTSLASLRPSSSEDQLKRVLESIWERGNSDDIPVKTNKNIVSSGSRSNCKLLKELLSNQTAQQHTTVQPRRLTALPHNNSQIPPTSNSLLNDGLKTTFSKLGVGGSEKIDCGVMVSGVDKKLEKGESMENILNNQFLFDLFSSNSNDLEKILEEATTPMDEFSSSGFGSLRASPLIGVSPMGTPHGSSTSLKSETHAEDDFMLISQLEQVIMAANLSVDELDILLSNAADGADVADKQAIEVIQRQLMGSLPTPIPQTPPTKQPQASWLAARLKQDTNSQNSELKKLPILPPVSIPPPLINDQTYSGNWIDNLSQLMDITYPPNVVVSPQTNICELTLGQLLNSSNNNQQQSTSCSNSLNKYDIIVKGEGGKDVKDMPSKIGYNQSNNILSTTTINTTTQDSPINFHPYMGSLKVIQQMHQQQQKVGSDMKGTSVVSSNIPTTSNKKFRLPHPPRYFADIGDHKPNLQKSGPMLVSCTSNLVSAPISLASQLQKSNLSTDCQQIERQIKWNDGGLGSAMTSNRSEVPNSVASHWSESGMGVSVTGATMTQPFNAKQALKDILQGRSNNVPASKTKDNQDYNQRNELFGEQKETSTPHLIIKQESQSQNYQSLINHSPLPPQQQQQGLKRRNDQTTRLLSSNQNNAATEQHLINHHGNKPVYLTIPQHSHIRQDEMIHQQQLQQQRRLSNSEMAQLLQQQQLSNQPQHLQLNNQMLQCNVQQQPNQYTMQSIPMLPQQLGSQHLNKPIQKYVNDQFNGHVLPKSKVDSRMYNNLQGNMIIPLKNYGNNLLTNNIQQRLQIHFGLQDNLNHNQPQNYFNTTLPNISNIGPKNDPTFALRTNSLQCSNLDVNLQAGVEFAKKQRKQQLPDCEDEVNLTTSNNAMMSNPMMTDATSSDAMMSDATSDVLMMDTTIDDAESIFQQIFALAGLDNVESGAGTDLQNSWSNSPLWDLPDNLGSGDNSNFGASVSICSLSNITESHINSTPGCVGNAGPSTMPPSSNLSKQKHAMLVKLLAE